MIQVKHPLSKTYLADSVYQAIIDNIVNGSLESGTELSEVGLAAELQVSRTPVHEAVARLLREGLLVQHPNRKLTVARLSRRQIREVYEMRLLLEGAAAERAATRMPPKDLVELQEWTANLQRQIGSPGWTEKALQFDLRFHDVLARAAGNDRLRDEIARTRLLVRALCRATGTPENLEAAFREHAAILAAVAAKDPSLAARRMREHIQSRLNAVLQDFDPEE